MPTPTVFISYSHKDEEWKDRLVTHLGVLQMQDLLDVWDDRRIEAGEDWYAEIEEAINAASVAVLLVTANFLTSKFILSEEVPRFLQRRDEQGVRIFPVIVKPCAWQPVKWLSRMQVRPKDGRPLSGGSEHQIDADLAAIAEEILGIVQRAEAAPTPAGFVPLGPDKISLAKLPSTSPDLFGRDDELAALDAAWSLPSSSAAEGEGSRPKTNVLSLVAWGGVGKTALVNKWLMQMGADNYRGAERVFGWSFYSQGAAEGRQVSADQFIAAALEWFGDPDPTKGSPWDKGERLAELVKRQRTLLVLDGLEPLQTPPPIETGRIKDPALSTLLRELARHNPGLVVITTRLAVDDLKDFTFSRESSPSATGEGRGGGAIHIDLEDLSPEAGAAYLRHLGVVGTDAELRDAAKDFGGHALALTLMGSYLKVVHGGDVRLRKEIARLTDEKKQGAHARRVMESYERWFAGKPELDILRLMGLFDRPAARGALDALRAEPPISHLTSNLQSLSHADWQWAVQNLRDVRLIAAPDPHEPETLDCHPLLREHFGDRLRTDNPEAWREAHSRLYEYYKSDAKELPDTIEEMAPLFAAVAHGCQAGRHQDALDEVYWRRIQRGGQFFNAKILGAIGSELAILSSFFNPPWRQPVAALSDAAKGFVLNECGTRLRALGRLAESAQPMQAALTKTISLKDWKNAAIYASNLSELYLTLGDVQQALDVARQSVELAERSGDAFQRVTRRATLANALYQAGQVSDAEATFREAEEMQKEHQPTFQLLYSRMGFLYCDLLLSQGKYVEVQNRAGQTLEWARHERILLDIALNNLSLGRAYLMQAQLDPHSRLPSLPGRGGDEGPYVLAAAHLDRAVEGLRQAGQQDQMPLGLLARAELCRVTGAFDKARRDLDEAFAIAARGGMRLHQADCHLEYARLHLAMNDKAKARESLITAKHMIEEMGYHRRDKEVQELEAQL